MPLCVMSLFVYFKTEGRLFKGWHYIGTQLETIWVAERSHDPCLHVQEAHALHILSGSEHLPRPMPADLPAQSGDGPSFFWTGPPCFLPQKERGKGNHHSQTIYVSNIYPHLLSKWVNSWYIFPTWIDWDSVGFVPICLQALACFGQTFRLIWL